LKTTIIITTLLMTHGWAMSQCRNCDAELAACLAAAEQAYQVCLASCDKKNCEDQCLQTRNVAIAKCNNDYRLCVNKNRLVKLGPCQNCQSDGSIEQISGSPCDDNNPCTTNDVCINGVCTGTPLNGTPCDDGDPCTENDRCIQGNCGGDPVTSQEDPNCNGG